MNGTPKAAQKLIASTSSGLLRGTYEDGVIVYRGVPFAQPPIGPLRFRPPEPGDSWSGVRDANVSGPASYQINDMNKAAVDHIVNEIDPGVSGIMAWPDYVGTTYHQARTSEDCLYLDIWVPDTVHGQALPVYLYYHGGANAASSGSFVLERGANLAREANIIVVRPNYRMGALGWVHFGLWDTGVESAINLGVQDQFAALCWTYENIEGFGGDPENITIGGESAGATAVSHLLTNPAAHKYFRRAVLQSLSPFNPWCTQQQPEARAVVQQYVDLLNLNDFSDLESIDPNRLLAAQNILTRKFDPDWHLAWRPLGAVVDGYWVHKAPALHLSEDRINKPDLEVVIGFAKDEWQFFRGHSSTVRSGSHADVMRVLRQVFGPAASENLYQRYAVLHPGHSPGTLLSDIMSFEYFKLSSLAIAQNLSSQQIPVRLFQFSYDLPGLAGTLGAVHTGDIPFLFRNHTERDLSQWPAFEGVDRHEIERVSTEVGELYASFIRNGDPGPPWPPFSRENWEILWFGQSVESRRGLLQSEWEAFQEAGFDTMRSLEEVLVENTRNALSGEYAP